MEEAKEIPEKWKKINSMINAASELVSPSNYDGYVQQLQDRIKELEEHKTQQNLELGSLRVECERLKDALMEFYTPECPDEMKQLLQGRDLSKWSELKELEGSDNQEELWNELWEIIINGKAGTPENKTSYLEKQFRIVRIK